MNRPLSVLDFGSGTYGTGRIALESALTAKDTCDLFDPYAEIEEPSPSSTKQIHIVDEERVWNTAAPSYDLINISYTLCCMPTVQAKQALIRLRERNPDAVFIIVDYILHGRSVQESLGLLQAGAELKLRAKIGDEEFFRARSRFTPETLADFVRNTGLQVSPQDVHILDTYTCTRAAITANCVKANINANSDLPADIMTQSV